MEDLSDGVALIKSPQAQVHGLQTTCERILSPLEGDPFNLEAEQPPSHTDDRGDGRQSDAAPVRPLLPPFRKHTSQGSAIDADAAMSSW